MPKLYLTRPTAAAANTAASNALSVIFKTTDSGGGYIGNTSEVPYAPPAVAPTIEYILTADLKTLNGQNYLSFRYSSPPGANAADRPLMMNVPKGGCIIKLTLDGSMSWRFKQGDVPMYFGPAEDTALDPPEERYSSAQPPTIPSGCQSIFFYAPYVDAVTSTGASVSNHDRVNFLVQVDQLSADGTKVLQTPLLLILDPDIKNPGDDTSLTGMSP